MVSSVLFVLSLASVAVAQSPADARAQCPAEEGSKGGLPIMGFGQTGLFGCGAASSPPGMSLQGMIQTVLPVFGMTGGGSGSGPYKSNYAAPPGLDGHTLYTPQQGVNSKIPVIVWGNGMCAGWGGWFSNFLNEVASHGFYIVANGGTSASGILSFTKGTDLPDAIDWIHKVAGTDQFPNMDKTRIAVAGQSCGGIQAYTASLDPRIKATAIFNSGLINEVNKKHFPKLHAPVGYFLGGPTDIAYANGERDFIELPAKIPRTKANLPVGHMATYGETNGGKFGKAAVSWFKWQLYGDQAEGQKFLNPAASALTQDGWNITSKGY